MSINIPYIKGTPEEGGTHGIIGKEVLAHFKPGAVLLNFARGELVDSEAMRDFLDNSNGVYISDFPDDVLWNHPKTIILPHLGASTAEAEDEAAKMAAETIIDYLEHGTIRNSVNFPSTNLPERSDNIIRLTVVNQNIPGMLSKITDCISKAGVNIAQQINQSRGDIAYNVIDLDPTSHPDGLSLNLKDLQREMTMLEGVLSTRCVINYLDSHFGQPDNSPLDRFVCLPEFCSVPLVSDTQGILMASITCSSFQIPSSTSTCCFVSHGVEELSSDMPMDVINA